MQHAHHDSIFSRSSRITAPEIIYHILPPWWDTSCRNSWVCSDEAPEVSQGRLAFRIDEETTCFLSPWSKGDVMIKR